MVNVLDDDRVVPLHSFKHIATLQHLHPNNPHPLIVRIDKKAGHGAGKSTEKRWEYPLMTYYFFRSLVVFSIQENADKLGFVVQTLGLEPRSRS